MLNPVSEDIYEAVFFLEDQFVSRKMHYSEFESLLDSRMSFKGYSDTEVSAVYVEIASNLAPTALVFFKLYFDESGIADPEWNVPLRRLARISGSGPDLGAGPIKLACRSQCAISWHQRDLWDPDMAPGGNDFQILKKELAQNKLGFGESNPDLVELDATETDIPVLTAAVLTTAPRSPDYNEADFIEEQEKEHRNKLARLLKAQRLRIKTLNSQHEAEVEEITRQCRIELQGHKNKERELEQTVQHNKVLNDQLKSKLQKRNNQVLGLREDLVKHKAKIAHLEGDLVNALPASEFDLLKQRLEGETSVLKEQLERRSTELDFRDNKEANLKSEIGALKERLKSNEDEDILKRLNDLDIVFVVYHTGAGHITLSLKDVRRYMESPTAFVADKCGVGEDIFKLWLKHNENPVCDICKKQINRISQPAEFINGKNNRCEDHSYD